MIIRVAHEDDIEIMMTIRLSVHENVLSDPSLVTPLMCRDYLQNRGRGWVAVVEDEVRGFAIADSLLNEVWALFVSPDYEGQGLGRALHTEMMTWFQQIGAAQVTLTTEPGSRASRFYAQAGWMAGEFASNGDQYFRFVFKDE